MEDKITLDRKAFKVLASDTRIDILKSLNRRRMTLTELSKRLGMSASTVKEHMESLSSAGLIERKDEGHKWKYYELTGKGRDILNPVDKRVFFILGLSLVVMIAGFYSMLSYMAGPVLEGERVGDVLQAPASQGAEALPAASSALPVPEIAVVAVSVIVAVLCLGYLVKKRGMRLTS
jgi:DNA-binding transcriptional ArsR family regulator